MLFLHETLFRLMATGVTICCAAGPVAAQTWTGGTNTNWSDPSNWDGGIAPGTSAIAIIDNAALANQPRVNVAQTVAETRISVGTLTLANTLTTDVTLTGVGNLEIGLFQILNGSVVLDSSGTLINAGMGQFDLRAGQSCG
ncbi:MAG: hypothetical protein II336_20000 [Loktanella sp.]|nr:hypothetical protein [Loktanella sp.]